MGEMIAVNIPVLAGADSGCTNCGSCSGGRRAVVLDVWVAAGLWVEKDEPLLTLETNKAILDVQAPCRGTVHTLQVKVGDSVEEGQLFLQIDSGNFAGG